MRSKIIIGCLALVAALYFPLTARFKPASEIVGQTVVSDVGPARQFGGTGFFHSEPVREAVVEVKNVPNPEELPEAHVEDWMDHGKDAKYISPAHAHAQAKRIALAQDLPLEDVNRLIDKYTTSPFLGTDKVNVKKLNTALLKLQEKRSVQ